MHSSQFKEDNAPDRRHMEGKNCIVLKQEVLPCESNFGAKFFRTFREEAGK